MRTPVFQLHILPMFRATDREHMRSEKGLDLWDYDQVRVQADFILDCLKGEGRAPAKSRFVQFVPRTRWPRSQAAGSSRVASRERARRPTRTFRYFAGVLPQEEHGSCVRHGFA